MFLKQRKRWFHSKTLALLSQKQLWANEINICHPYIYYALSAISKFKFEPLFDFIKMLRISQTAHTNSLSKYEFWFLHFYSDSGKVNLLQFCGLVLDVFTIKTRAYLDPYLARTGKLTDFSGCEQQVINFLMKFTKCTMIYASWYWIYLEYLPIPILSWTCQA